MDTTLEELVWRRARARCDYCQLPQVLSPLTHQIDHIIARKHHGPTEANNLALACDFWKSQTSCLHCHTNRPSSVLVALYSPRRDSSRVTAPCPRTRAPRNRKHRAPGD